MKREKIRELKEMEERGKEGEGGMEGEISREICGIGGD